MFCQLFDRCHSRCKYLFSHFLFTNNTPLNQITFPHFKMKISLHHDRNTQYKSSTTVCLLSHCVCCYNLQCTKIDDLLSKQPLNFSTRSLSLSFFLVLNEFVSCLVYVNFEKSVLSLSTICCDVLKLDITNTDRSLT